MEEQIILLKQLRTNQKISITKTINKIQDGIQNYMKIENMEQNLDKLQEKFKNTEEYTHKLKTLDVDNEEYEKWSEDLHKAIQPCIEEALRYIKSVEEHKEETNQLQQESSTRKSKQSNNIKHHCKVVEDRINMLNDLMKQKETSVVKIRTLQEKLQDLFNETNSRISNLEWEEGDNTWIDDLRLKVDMCTVEVMEYLKDLEDNIPKDTSDNQKNICDKLKRIELPIFDGNKANYFNWKTALCRY